jgi:translation initiation factor eIF-2B subunit gamma
MGTAELLRLPEVQACIKGDFMVLPCDLVCEVPGEEIVGGWFETQSALAGAKDGHPDYHPISSNLGVNGEKSGRRGGFGVWYPIKSAKENQKEDLPDFLMATRLDREKASPACRPSPQHPTVRESLCKVAYASPMDSLRDKIDRRGVLRIRKSMLKRHGRVKALTTFRDAHIYIFPYWVKHMIAMNERFESIGEDLIGWWAKAGWQGGLPDKLRMREAAHRRPTNVAHQVKDKDAIEFLEDSIDLVGMTTTQSRMMYNVQSDGSLALPAGQRTLQRADTMQENIQAPLDKNLPIPELLAYIQPPAPSGPIIRRIDNSPLLLSATLRIAKLDPIAHADNPFTHERKVMSPEKVAQRSTITRVDCLVGENTTVEEKSVIKESVVGSNCRIGSGSRLTKCLVMDDVTVGERCTLTGCIIGRKTKIGKDVDLRDCEVQDGNVVPDGTEARGEKFLNFEGMEDTTADVDEEEDGDLIG